MGTHARIEHGSIVIDVSAWLQRRSAGTRDDLTRDLHSWATRHHLGDGVDHTVAGAPRLGRYRWQQTVLAWCDARGHVGPDPADPLAGPTLVSHEMTRLDRDLWAALAVTALHQPIAVVQVEDEAPVVLTDVAAEAGEWFDAHTVEIRCPGGHGWTWRAGRELFTADGAFTTLTLVFGAGLDAPFSRCRVCTEYESGRRSRPCDCDGNTWIVCPSCERRCDVDLPGTAPSDADPDARRDARPDDAGRDVAGRDVAGRDVAGRDVAGRDVGTSAGTTAVPEQP